MVNGMPLCPQEAQDCLGQFIGIFDMQKAHGLFFGVAPVLARGGCKLAASFLADIGAADQRGQRQRGNPASVSDCMACAPRPICSESAQ